MATLGNDNVVDILPEGVSEDAVKITTGDDNNNAVVFSQNVKDTEIIEYGGDKTRINGNKVESSTVSTSRKKGETSNLVLNTALFRDGTISNDGEGSLAVKVNKGRFNKSVINGGDKNRNDLVEINDNIIVNRTTIDLGKGDDTVRFGKGVTLKGKTTIDLGKGDDTVRFGEGVTFEGRTTIDLGTQDDTVRFGEGVTFEGKTTIDLGKGDDTVRFGKGVTFKGTTTIDLGKGRTDSVIVEDDAVVGGGKLSITNFTRNDTIKVGNDTYNYNKIKNGAQIPGIDVKLA